MIDQKKLKANIIGQGVDCRLLFIHSLNYLITLYHFSANSNKILNLNAKFHVCSK